MPETSVLVIVTFAVEMVNRALENTIIIFPSIDATQEFKVDTGVAPVQYGRAGGAI